MTSNPEMLIVFVIVVIAAIFVRKSVCVVREDQRMVVERLGRFSRVAGPGLHVILPFLDRSYVFRPDDLLPGWQGYPAERLEKKLAEKYYQQANR